MDNVWKAIQESPASIYAILTSWLAYLHLSRPSNATCMAKHAGIEKHDALFCKKIDAVHEDVKKLTELFVNHLEARK